YCSLMWVLLVAALIESHDPACVLSAFRDKILAMTVHLPKYACTETVDRSYFTRLKALNGRTSCDQILGERKRAKLRLDSPDRLRFHIRPPGHPEPLSRTDVPPRTLSINDLVDSGPIATGFLGTHLEEIFSNPGTRFQFQNRNGTILEFSFHTPGETSRSLMLAGDTWQPAGYEGSVWIDAKGP